MKFSSVLALGLAILIACVDARQRDNCREAPGLEVTSSNVDCSLPVNQVTLHPHPTQCNLYLQCVHGVAIERPCARGTEFSPSVGVCVWPQDSGCRSTPGQSVDPSICNSDSSRLCDDFRCDNVI
ncbi:unnamed protein product [Ceutorhynchus assimilis]|uniref:Chitin-binding type-2 domain-containing protein n=1 Tax=Ceutorhynchus assimilis TaxID=467358 RepID=A0A9N9QC65_9CUCU|nr:unnamed protein product [Ceutorhynchus assimilis]